MAIRIALLLNCCGLILGTSDVALYPQGRVPVCVEDTLPEFVCTLAPGRQLLEWRINIMLENETMVDSYSRLVDTSGQVPGLMAHSIVFSFATSAISPLMSTLSISGVTENLTSIEVICVDRVEQTSSSTLLKIINSDILPKPEVMNLTIQILQQDDNGIDITIDLQWRRSSYQKLFHYSINVFPNQIQDLLSSNSTCIKLRVLYNTLYNLSMVAAPRCGHPQLNSTPLNIGILYPDCEEHDSSHKNSSYVYQAIEGTTIPNQCSGNTGMVTMYTHPTSYGISQNSPNISIGVNVTAIVGATVGCLVGIVLICATSILVVDILWKTKCINKVGSMDFSHKQKSLQNVLAVVNDNSAMELDQPHHDDENDSKVAPKSLLYAEIGQSSFNQQQHKQPIFLSLDDNRIEYAKLKHNPKNNSNFSVTLDQLDDSLNINLDNLLIQLKPQVGPKWYEFGVAAGIEKDVLDKFAEQCSPDDCIVEVIDYWLRKSMKFRTLSWRDVAKILKDIGLSELAHDIEGIYTTGKFPVEVNMDWVPEFQKENLVADIDHEPLPPPVPPKMIEDWDSHGQDSHDILNNHQMVLEAVATTYADDLLPVLPPRPKNWNDAPPRPPKSSTAKL